MRTVLALTITGILAASVVAISIAQTQKKREVLLRPPRQQQQMMQWSVGTIAGFTSVAGAKASRTKDGSILLTGVNPETDTYTVAVDTAVNDVAALRIEAVTDPGLGGNGPGRTPHGNFVLSEVTASYAPSKGAKPAPVKFARVESDFAQDGFPAANAIDGNPRTGWAIQGRDAWNVNRTLTLTLSVPVSHPGGARWTIKLDQQFGSNHTIGKFRLLFGSLTAAGGGAQPLTPLAGAKIAAQPSRVKQPALQVNTNLPFELKTGILIPQILATGNWDFENGLQGWTPGAESGDTRAFQSQPTFGDNMLGTRLADSNVKEMGFNPAIRTQIGGDYWQAPVYSGYQGDYWIGSSENRPNVSISPGGRSSEFARGNLASPDFAITKSFLSFLVSGGKAPDLRVELQIKSSNPADMDALDASIQAWLKSLGAGAASYTAGSTAIGPCPRDGQYIVAARALAPGTDAMTRIAWQTPGALTGRVARYKVIDNSVTSHINVDDFRAAPAGPASATPVWGFVDTHTHPMIHMAFGGGAIWGQPGGNLETSVVPVNELLDCDGFTHGNATGVATAVLDHIMRFIGNFTGPFHRHEPGGFMGGYNGWPAASGIGGLMHQQMHIQWIKRAFDGGQRILVAAAINNQLLHRGLKNGFDFTGNKFTTPTANLDFDTCVQQTVAMKNLVNLNSHWMEVVTTPAQARAAIRNNKMAVVLAVETDWLNGMDQVRTLYNLGVRHITPVHLMDNVFGSSAVYDMKFISLNEWYHGRIFDVDDGVPVGVKYLPERFVPLMRFAGNVLTVPGFPSGQDLFDRGYTVNNAWPPSALKHAGYINKWGLKNYTRVIGGGPQPDPVAAYKEMMRMGMMIDIAHMSHKSVEEMLQLADNQLPGEDGYPLSSSHGGIREHEDHTNERSLSVAQNQKVLKMGGTVAIAMGPGGIKTAPSTAVANDAPGTTKSFAQLVQHSNALFGTQIRTGGLTLGSDFNGMNGMMGPRFGAKAPSGASQNNGIRYLNYSSPGVPVKTLPILRPSTMIGGKGLRTFDFNIEGLAHCGMVPDMFQDAINAGLPPAQLGRLFRGAEDFIRMWEKCEQLKASIN